MQSSRRFDEILIVDHPEKMSCAPARTSLFGLLVKYAGREREQWTRQAPRSIFSSYEIPIISH